MIPTEDVHFKKHFTNTKFHFENRSRSFINYFGTIFSGGLIFGSEYSQQKVNVALSPEKLQCVFMVIVLSPSAMLWLIDAFSEQ